MVEYRIDEFGRAVIDGGGVFDLIARGGDLNGFHIEMDEAVRLYNEQCRSHGKDEFVIPEPTEAPVPLSERTQTWNVPEGYADLDVKELCLSRCTSDVERIRVEEEMVLFEQRNLLPLLRSLVYAVEQFKENGVLWGVGRGSSVASYVLFLLGVHRIDSIQYGLDIREFLR